MALRTLFTPGKSTVRDMTSGSIVKQIVMFSLPLMLGNIFQMLYNTVDSIVVGNYVGTQALAAVGSTTMITNLLVFFFNGFSVGAGVVISHHFGAREMEKLHIAVETTILTAFIFSAVLSVGGVLLVKPLLRLMATPADVMDEATLYLRIYIGGISGLLMYNMGSGVLRAVGDTIRPLLFLILTSVLNVFLDLFFVLVLHMGVAGVGYATILAQFISAGLTLRLLTRTQEVYKLVWKDLKIDFSILRRVLSIGVPAGIQSIITTVSNVFVQSYINFFGSSCMAGWSAYNKLDQFVMLPTSTLAMAATTFVSQNLGAKQKKRADRGTVISVLFTVGVIFAIVLMLFIGAYPVARLFTKDASVIDFGVLFIRANVLFMPFNCVAHVLMGALRGRGDSRGPMICILSNYVGVRQIYLYVVTHFIANTPKLVGFGYPVGWITCAISETAYFFLKHKRADRNELN